MTQRRRRPPTKARQARARAKRKRRLDAVPREKINKVVLYERQGGLCTYCDEPLVAGHAVEDILAWGAPAVRWLHKDHVHPIAYGGWDTLDNVALLHPACNGAKGRRIWPIGVTPHKDTPSTRLQARKDAIAWWRDRARPMTTDEASCEDGA